MENQTVYSEALKQEVDADSIAGIVENMREFSQEVLRENHE